MLLRGGRAGLRADLAARYFAETGAAAGGQALTDSTLILEGLAATQPPERLHLRVAEHDGTIYVDTGRQDGHVIRIGQGRWVVAETAPVRFLRTKLTGAMPLPPRDGDVARLWDFVNVAAEDRPVLLATLVAALVQCDVPHPVLALFAEQGSAKSTTTRMLVDLIDPSPVPLRQAPRDADSWVTAASGSWVVALDNLSAIPPWLSDSLCRAATGDGNVKRALYTDADLAVLKFRRCVIVNGIDVGAVRPDLAERLATVELRRIDRRRRRSEATLRQEWLQALPGILGGLLDLAAAVHQRLETVSVDESPRMADYGRALAAVDEVGDRWPEPLSVARGSAVRGELVRRSVHRTTAPAHPRAARRKVRRRPAGHGHAGWRPLAAAQGMAEERPGCHGDSAAARAGASKPGVGHRGRRRAEPPQRPAVDDLPAATRFDAGTSLAILASLAAAAQRYPINRGGDCTDAVRQRAHRRRSRRRSLVGHVRLDDSMSVLPDKMESASAPTGMVAVSLDSELEQLADAAVADWPDISFSGEFDAAVIDLYRSHLQFPPSWPQERRDEFITSNAEMDSLALTERFDDVIDTVIDGYVRRHGILPHGEDAEAMIDADAGPPSTTWSSA